MTDFFGKLKSGAGKVAFEADKMARVNRAQGELSQIKHQIEVQFIKLGQLQYQCFLNPDSESPDSADICRHIQTLEAQMEHKALEIQRIYAESYAPAGAAVPAPAAQADPAAAAAAAPAVATPAEMSEPSQAPLEPVAPTDPQALTKICPNCGREMAAGVKFCPDCGAKM